MSKLFNSITDKQLNKLNNVRKSGLTIGFTNGCFDLLHDGHVHLLSSAKNLCDYLVVGLNSDQSVKKIKGSERPIEDVRIRTQKLINNDNVDLVIVFDELTPARLIRQVLPEVIIKGADYSGKQVVGQEIVENNGGRIEFIELLPGFSTSKIIKERNL